MNIYIHVRICRWIIWSHDKVDRWSICLYVRILRWKRYQPWSCTRRSPAPEKITSATPSLGHGGVCRLWTGPAAIVVTARNAGAPDGSLARKRDEVRAEVARTFFAKTWLICPKLKPTAGATRNAAMTSEIRTFRCIGEVQILGSALLCPWQGPCLRPSSHELINRFWRVSFSNTFSEDVLDKCSQKQSSKCRFCPSVGSKNLCATPSFWQVLVFVLGSSSGFYHHAHCSSRKIACDGSDVCIVYWIEVN